MRTARTAYLSLGSNVGDRLESLRAAVRLLDEAPDVQVVARSSVYETEPVGDLLDQPDFLNAVVGVVTELEPHELLGVCKGVERELGREPGGPRHGPRSIDVDLLLVDGTAVTDPGLVLPHPELTGRRFVLAPLAELAPRLTVSKGRTVSAALAALGEGQRVERFDKL